MGIGRQVERVALGTAVFGCWVAYVVVPIARSLPLEPQGGLSVDQLLPGLAWTFVAVLVTWRLGGLPGRRSWPWLLGVTGVALCTGSMAFLPFEFAIDEAEGSTWTAFFPMAGIALALLALSGLTAGGSAAARRRPAPGTR